MSRAGLVRAQRRAGRGERFTAVMAACVGRLPFGLARIAAGACEALYMYAAMRWLVFRDVHAQDRPAAGCPGPGEPGASSPTLPL
jgi:hypothetical protein